MDVNITAHFLREYHPKECQKDHFLMYAVRFCLTRHFDHYVLFQSVLTLWNGSNDSLYLNVVYQAIGEHLAPSKPLINTK